MSRRRRRCSTTSASSRPAAAATPQTGRAAYYFTKAAEADPDDPDYAFNLGYAYWLEREPQAAIYWLPRRCGGTRPTATRTSCSAPPCCATGSASKGEREKELARQLSSTYVEWERRPNAAAEPVPRGSSGCGTTWMRPARRPWTAAFAPGRAEGPEELAAFHPERGRRLFEQQQDEEAIPELKRSLYLLPYQAEVHLLLGRIYLRSGPRDRGHRGAEDLAVEPGLRRGTRRCSAKAYLPAKDEAGARAELQKAPAARPAATPTRSNSPRGWTGSSGDASRERAIISAAGDPCAQRAFVGGGRRRNGLRCGWHC